MATVDESLEATQLSTMSAETQAGAGPASSGDGSAGANAEAATLEIQSGGTLGRYTVLSQLGAGAMGVVYEAFDRDLDRRVAVKLLRRGSSEALISEAQAMAKLTHAHVVAVYDVGTVRIGPSGGGGQVFVAMEYLSGGTLRTWLDAAARTAEDVVAVFVAAGEGLAAAHRAGLVHRDFKLDNVLMTAQGEPKVTDFGLAHSIPELLTATEGPGDPQATSVDVASTSQSELSTDGTTPATQRTLRPKGRMAGTPAYMAPELFRGGEASPRSDQFSFCVALWEALYGQRPYSASNLVALGMAICNDRRDPPPRDVVVPRRVVDVLERGLSTDPEARYAAMPALLTALRPPAPKRSTSGAAAIAALGIVAGLGLGWGLLHRDEPETIDPCDDAAASVDAVWSEGAQADLRSAIEAGGGANASDAAQHVLADLEDYAAALAAARTGACQRRIAQRDGADLDARRAVCLDRREQELSGLLAALETVDEAQVDRLMGAVAKLPSLSACDDPERLLAAVPPPDAEQAEAVVEIRRELARVHTLTAAESSGYLEAAAAVDERADALGYRPLISETAHALGRAQLGRERLDDAVISFRHAFVEGLRVGHDEVASEAAAELLYIVGVEQGQAEAGRQWADNGLALAERGGHARARAQVLSSLAVLDRIGGKLELAVEHSREVVELLEAELGPEHLDTGRAYGNHGVAQIAAGHPAEGLKWLERCASIYEAKYGSTHPRVAPLYLNMSAARVALGQLEAGKQDLDRALANHEANDGSAKDIAFVRAGLSDIAALQGDWPTAIAHREFVVTAFNEYYGDAHPIAASADLGLAIAYLRQGEAAKALPRVERALTAIASTDAEVPDDLGPKAKLIAGAVYAQTGDSRGKALLQEGWTELSAIEGAAVDADLAPWLDAHPEVDPRSE